MSFSVTLEDYQAQTSMRDGTGFCSHCLVARSAHFAAVGFFPTLHQTPATELPCDRGYRWRSGYQTGSSG